MIKLFKKLQEAYPKCRVQEEKNYVSFSLGGAFVYELRIQQEVIRLLASNYPSKAGFVECFKLIKQYKIEGKPINGHKIIYEAGVRSADKFTLRIEIPYKKRDLTNDEFIGSVIQCCEKFHQVLMPLVSNFKNDAIGSLSELMNDVKAEKKAKEQASSQSIQSQIASAVCKKFKDAVVKKVDKDNYLDIHLPFINEKKGTHLGVNTARDMIRMVFYCRDAAFVEELLSKSDALEEYSQGIRPLGDPTYTDVKSAVKGIFKFIEELDGTKRIESELKEDKSSEDDEINLDSILQELGYESEIDLEEDTIDEEEENEAVEIDDNYYLSKEVKIGQQIWMKRNLNVDSFLNGDPIFEATTSEEWEEAGNNRIPACCFYDNDPENGEKYGRIYNWYAVSDPRGLAPEGWKVPSNEDFEQLSNYLGGDEVAGVALKSNYGWENEGEEEDADCRGTNQSGFNGLPGGSRGEFKVEDFYAIGGNGDWWTNSEDEEDENCGIKRGLAFDCMDFEKRSSLKSCGFSVRCLKDLTEGEDDEDVYDEEYQDGNDEDVYDEEYQDENEEYEEEILDEDENEPSNELDADEEEDSDDDPLKIEYEDIAVTQYNFIDINGDFLSPINFDSANDFSDGFARVRSNGETFYIKSDGKRVDFPDGIHVHFFSEGIFGITKADLFGFADTSGKVIVPFKYDAAENFINGFAKVELAGKSIIINSKGQEIWVVDESQYFFNFSFGLASVLKDEKYGYIDESGRLVIDYKYDEASDFNKNVALVTLGDKKLLIDKNGKEITLLQYQDIENLSEGLFCVQNDKEKYGYVNEQGKEVIACKYDEAKSFENGYAEVELKNKKSLIDINGNVCLNLEDFSYSGFSEGFYLINNDVSWKFIGVNGKPLTQQHFDDAKIFVNGYAAVKKDEKWGVIDTSGKQVIPFMYNYISDISDEYFLVGFEVTVQQEKFNGKVIINSHPIIDYNDPIKIKSIIASDPSQIKFIDSLLMNDEDFLVELLTINSDVFPFFPTHFRQNIKIVRAALENGFFHSSLLSFIDYSDNQHLAKVVKSSWLSFLYLPDDVKSRELTKLAILEHNYEIEFEHLPENLQTDFSFLKEVLDAEQNNKSFHIDNSLYEGYSCFFSEDRDFILKYRQIKWASEKIMDDREFLLVYLEKYPSQITPQNFNALTYSDGAFPEIIQRHPQIENDRTFCLKAVKLFGPNYVFLSEELRADPEIFDCALSSPSSKDITMDFLPNALALINDDVNHPNIDVITRLVEANPTNISRIPFELMKHHELARSVLYAARKTNNVLYYAPPNLRKDKNLVRSIVQENPIAVIFAHWTIRDSKDFMLPLVQKVPSLLKFCLPKLKADKAFILEAVKQNGLVIKHVSEALKNDEEVYWTALRQNARSYRFLPDKIQALTGVQSFVAGVNGEWLNVYEGSISKQIKFSAILHSNNGCFTSEIDVYKGFDDQISQEALLHLLRIDPTQVVFLSEGFLTSDVRILESIIDITPYPLTFDSCRNLMDPKKLQNLIKKNSWFFQYLTEEEKKDQNFIKEMLSINGHLLKHCTEDQKLSLELIEIALKQDVSAIEHVSPKLDWNIDEFKRLAIQVLTEDPCLIKHFIQWDHETLNEFFFHAFALDSEVINFMEQDAETPWWFMSDSNGSYEMDNDELAYGINQELKFYHYEPVSGTLTNLCLALEREKANTNWESLFESWENDTDLVSTAFRFSPCEENYLSIKNLLGTSFVESEYVVPEVVSLYPEIYMSLSETTQLNKDIALALISSEEGDLEDRLKMLHPRLKKEKAFCLGVADLEIEYELLEKYFGKEIVQDESFLMRYLVKNAGYFSSLPDRLKRNRNLTLQYAIHSDQFDSLDIDESLYTDKEFFIHLAKNNTYKNFTLSEEIYTKTDILDVVIPYQPQIVKNMDESFLGIDMIKKLIKLNVDVVQHLPIEMVVEEEVLTELIKTDITSLSKLECYYALPTTLESIAQHQQINTCINYFEDVSVIQYIESVGTVTKRVLNKQTPNEVVSPTQFYVNAPCEFVLGYDRSAYVTEDVAGIVSDHLITELFTSDLEWSDFIWDNNWYDVDSIYHEYGIIEPATDLELPNGERVPINLEYEAPDYDQLEECFNCSSAGDFIQIASSDEKAYGWDNWKRYSIQFEGGVFDLKKINVDFDGSKVSGYDYAGESFEDNEEYSTSGKGFSSSLYFNNGEKLIEISVEDLREEMQVAGVDLENFESIKQFVLSKRINEN